MISYGYQVAPENDKYVSLADEALAALGRAGLFGTFLVDYIPLCEFTSRPVLLFCNGCVCSETCTIVDAWC